MSGETPDRYPLAGRLGASVEWLCDALDAERNEVKSLRARLAQLERDADGYLEANGQLYRDLVASRRREMEQRAELGALRAAFLTGGGS